MKGEKGTILVALLFALVAAGIACALLTFSSGHLQVTGARTRWRDLRERTMADLQLYLHRYQHRVMQEDLGRYEDLEKDWFNQTGFPPTRTGQTLIRHRFRFRPLFATPHYRARLCTDRVRAQGPRSAVRQGADVQMRILCGEIPVLKIPFMINGEIRLFSSVPPEDGPSARESPLRSGNVDLNYDINRFLLTALGNPSARLDWMYLRRRLGMEVSPDPVPKGIYLLADDTRIHSVYIQGDLDQMTFSLHAPDQQAISFCQQGRVCRLWYSPGSPGFQTENIAHSGDPDLWGKTFSQILLVNGRIFSIIQEGDYAFAKNADIVLYVSRLAVIHSSLIGEPGGCRSHFTLINMAGGIFGRQPGSKGVTIEANSEVKLHGGIISSGTFANRAPELQIKGQLIAGELDNEGQLNIRRAPENPALADFFRTGDTKILVSFLIDWIGEETGE